MLTIGDVAKKTGVSIRSLRHYDEIGLLKPAGRSEADYRLYTKIDIFKLQQIVLLKSMGFSLKKIQGMIEDEAVSLQDTLDMQLDFLQQQLAQQQRVYQQVKHVRDLMVAHKDISLEMIYDTMEAIKMLEKYYTPEQLETLKQRSFHMDTAQQEKYSQAWQDVFVGMQKLKDQGVAATDVKTSSLAKEAMRLKALFTAGDKGIEQSLHTMYQQEGGAQMLRNHGLDVSDELYEYYAQAVRAHAK